MTGFERAKYEEGVKVGLEKGTSKTKEEDRISTINYYRKRNKTDEEINEILIEMGYDPILI